MKIKFITLYNLCARYGYNYYAAIIQNLSKHWTEDQIIDDLGNELCKQFYSKQISYDAYTKIYRYKHLCDVDDLANEMRSYKGDPK